MINIFKRWFSHSKEQDIDDSQNPWAGLASYEDPKTAERKLKFCGRDDDSYDMVRLIMGNVFVTLYGKSGIGKTSLLNAGVFPELRKEQYSPVSIRLGMRDEEHPLSYQTMIVEAVERVVKRVETINVIDEQQNQQAIDHLWNYFVCHRFYDKYDELTTPVIVFDQFEEVFRGHRDEAETLLRQLDYLNDKDHALDSCEVDGQSYRYEQNFRFVVSIREDDLYRLEDSIDNCYLPALKRCRYRLRSLSEQGARDAILIPGEGLFNPDEKDSIANAIIGKSRNDDGSISTNLISLLCNRIYVDFKKSGTNHITPSLVDSFIKGNPFERFYNEATQGFSNKEKSYIEDNFVDSTERRNSIPESDFLLHIKNGTKLLEGKNRILQRTSTSSNGKNNRVELIHDSFCECLNNSRLKRLAKRKFIRGISFLVFTLMSIVAVNSYFTLQNMNSKLQDDKARYIVSIANTLIDNHDLYIAKILLKNLTDKKIKYSKNTRFEIEYAFRKAYRYNRSKVSSLTACRKYLLFRPNSKSLIMALDSTINVIDVLSGQCLQTISTHGLIQSIALHPDGKRLICICDSSCVWDVETGQVIQKLTNLSFFPDVSYTDNGNNFFSFDMVRGTIQSYNANTYQLQHQVEWGLVLDNITIVRWARSVDFSPDGSKFVSMLLIDNSFIIKVWNSYTGECLHTLSDDQDQETLGFSPGRKKITTISGQVGNSMFSPDGKTIITTNQSYIMLWDTESGHLKNTYSGHEGAVTSAMYSTDGKLIVSASYDKTVRIWDSETGECLQIFNLEDEIQQAILSPDGQYIAVELNNTIELVETGKTECKQTFNTNIKDCDHIDYCSKGNIIRFISDSIISYYDTFTKKLIKKQIFPLDVQRYTLLSEDLHYFAMPNVKNSNIDIYDLYTYEIIASIKGINGFIDNLTFSPNREKIIFSSMINYKEWIIGIGDIKNGKVIEILQNNAFGQIEYVALSPNEQYIVFVSNGIHVWDREVGMEICVFKEQNFHPCAVSFSPNGKEIISISKNGTVKIWDFPPLEDLIDQTRERFKNRQLTIEERRKYYLE